MFVMVDDCWVSTKCFRRAFGIDEVRLDKTGIVFLQLPKANQQTVAFVFLKLACAWLVLGAKFWGLGKTAILSQRAVNSMQIGHAASEPQEKPSVSFI